MKMGKGMIFSVAVMLICIGGKWVEAEEVHHVVGGDRGWDPTSDLVSWSSHRIFRVGDQIWLTYSVAQGLVAELKSREEYEACDVSNPIKMYTEGLHSIPLEREGMRYFVSSDSQNCKNGLKLHVEVLPKDTHVTESSSTPAVEDSEVLPKATHVTRSSTTPTVEAIPPSTPSSASTSFGHNTVLMITAILCVAIGLAY